jgi:hypothetical protein
MLFIQPKAKEKNIMSTAALKSQASDEADIRALVGQPH